MDRCEHCWEMALHDSIVRKGHQAEFRYRTVVRIFHGETWSETGRRGEHREDPWRL